MLRVYASGIIHTNFKICIILRVKSLQQDNIKESGKIIGHSSLNQRILHTSTLYLSLCYEEIQTFYRNTKANNKI